MHGCSHVRADVSILFLDSQKPRLHGRADIWRRKSVRSEGRAAAAKESVPAVTIPEQVPAEVPEILESSEEEVPTEAASIGGIDLGLGPAGNNYPPPRRT